MDERIIQVEGLSKGYNIAYKRSQSYLTLRDRLASPLGYLVDQRQRRAQNKTFWALKDINFTVNRGEVLGVIGSNGAGKSTLLKILSRITGPTTGRIELNGRVASLLEVGTGFHPELTGRENIYLSGTILGMSRLEIKEAFEEIVFFSGVAAFIDAPVKRFSSGMRVRLGFAVAAHLRADILLIDEVLAVGDSSFQKKCIGKIGSIVKEGRTVLFVSHNLGAIRQLCTTAICLQKGKIHYQGEVSSAITAYLDQEAGHRFGNGRFEFSNKSIKAITLLDNQGRISTHFSLYPNLFIEVEFCTQHLLSLPKIGIVIRDRFGHALIGVNNRHYGEHFNSFNSNKGKFVIELKRLPLFYGNYTIDFFLGDINGDFEVLENAATFYLENDSDLVLNNINERINSVFVGEINWSIES